MVGKKHITSLKITMVLLVSALIMLTAINLSKEWLDTQGIILNFFVFYIFVSAALYMPILLIFGNTTKSLRLTLGLSMLHAAFDTWLPPYVLDIHGTLIQSTSIGYTGSIDYLFTIIGQAIGLSGSILYLFTYLLCPFIMLSASFAVIGAPRYLKELSRV